MKNRVDFQISEWYYKQAVADKTAKNTIRHHDMPSKKSKEIKKSSWQRRNKVISYRSCR